MDAGSRQVCQDKTCEKYGQDLVKGFCPSVQIEVERKAEKAYRAVLHYSREDIHDEEDIEADIEDLLRDLLHLADEYGGSYDILARATSNYRRQVLVQLHPPHRPIR